MRAARRRWLWIALAAILAVIVGAALALPRLLDLERHRGRIETALGEATGWNVELGELDFSLLRGLALTVSPVRLEAPGDTSSVEVATFAVRAELMPLLKGRLEVREIRLLRPRILLVRVDKDEGWVVPRTPEADAAPSGSETRPAPDKPPRPSTGDPAGEDWAGGGFTVAVDAVEMSDGLLRLEDRTVDPTLILALEDLDFRMLPASGEIRGEGSLGGDAGKLGFEGRRDGEIDVRLDSMRTDVIGDWLGGNLVHAGGTLDGEITLALPDSVKGRLTAAGLELFAGERPLADAQIGFELTATEGGWHADRIELTGEGVRLTGRGSLSPEIALALEMQATPIGDVLRFSRSVLPLPLELEDPGSADLDLRLEVSADGEVRYEARGSLSTARFVASEILPPVEDLNAHYELSRQGELDLRIDRARVGGGPLEGTAKIDSVDPLGTLTVDARLVEAALGQLVAGFVERAAETIVGPATLDAAVALDLGGETVDARSLGGRLDLSAEGVELPGWDLERAIRERLRAKLGKLADLAALVDPDLSDRLAKDRTDGEPAGPGLLDRLSANVEFSELPWRLDRLELRAGHVTALGGGSFDPLGGKVDLRFSARLDSELTREYVDRHSALRSLVNDEGQLELPLKIRGPMLGPEVDVDVEAALAGTLDEDRSEEGIGGLLKGLVERKLSKKKKP